MQPSGLGVNIPGAQPMASAYGPNSYSTHWPSMTVVGFKPSTPS